ncbi:MAG: hypothetical protein ACRCSV_03000 [Chlamydiales bacterium]
MKFYINRDEVHALIRSQFPDMLFYRYRCDFAESEDSSGITVKINDEPISSVVINNHLEEDYLPIGIYHLNRVSCSSPSPLKKLSQQIQSLFREKVIKKTVEYTTKSLMCILDQISPYLSRRYNWGWV